MNFSDLVAISSEPLIFSLKCRELRKVVHHNVYTLKAFVGNNRKMSEYRACCKDDDIKKLKTIIALFSVKPTLVLRTY